VSDEKYSEFTFLGNSVAILLCLNNLSWF